jgi:flavin-binding protein dodecin
LCLQHSNQARTKRMGPDHVYSVSEIVGTSETSIEDAIQTAVAKMNETKRNVRWFEVLETRGHVENGRVAHYQVAMKVGFTLDER